MPTAMNLIIKCLRCSTEMEEGFVMDAMMGGAMVARWVAGPPDSSWAGGVKFKGKEMRLLKTYRCPKCGYLESYANEVVQ